MEHAMGMMYIASQYGVIYITVARIFINAVDVDS